MDEHTWEVKFDVNTTFDQETEINYIKWFHLMINKRFEKLDPQLNKDQFLETLINVYLSIFLGKAQYLSVSQKWDGCYVAPQDLYMLLRIFTVFQESHGKLERSPLGCRDQKWMKMKKVIVYVGAGHLPTLAQFLSQLFKTKPTWSQYETTSFIGGNNNCVNLPQTFDFFKS